MSTPILINIFPKYYFQFYHPMTINTKFLSTSSKLFTKKQFRVKNRFTFQDDFKQNKVNSKYKKEGIFSSDLFSEQSECDQKSEDTSFTAHGFVSGDLLDAKNTIRRRIILHEKERKRKPSLTYQGEILFGVHPVYLALLQKKRIFHHLYTREEIDSSVEDNTSRKSEIIRLARSMNVPISFVDSRGLKILAPGAVHQGICLDAGFLPLSTWNENQYELDISENRSLWLVLDEIVDPMNVGAIIRSAHYFGVNKLFTVRGNSCKLSPTVSKASSGSLEVMDIYQIGNLEDFVKKRKDNGWCIVSTLAYSADKPEFSKLPTSADQFSTSKPVILILGNEGKGISPNVLKLCDSLISIEPGQMLPEGIDSLNVSVAAGVLLYVLNNAKNIKR